jgi:hypothetical protein
MKMSDGMKLADEIKDMYKNLCKEAISNELVEDQAHFKEVFVKTMNGQECQDILARSFDGDRNNAGFQRTVLNFVRTDFLTLLRVKTEKFRFYLSRMDHTTLAERDDKNRRYNAAFGFAIVQKYDTDTKEWADYQEAEIQAFRDASDNIRLSPGRWYQGNFEIGGLNNDVFLLRVHQQASRFDSIDAPKGWTDMKSWLAENYDITALAEASSNPSNDGNDYRLFRMNLISSWLRGSAKGQIGFMEFVDDSVSLSLAKDRDNSLRAIVDAELAATYGRGSEFLVLGIVQNDPQYGLQLNIKVIEEVIAIKRKQYKTTPDQVGNDEDDEEIDASAWVNSKVSDDDEEWETDEEEDEEAESDEEAEITEDDVEEDDEEDEDDPVEEEIVEEEINDEDEDDWEDLDEDF